MRLHIFGCPSPDRAAPATSLSGTSGAAVQIFKKMSFTREFTILINTEEVNLSCLLQFQMFSESGNTEIKILFLIYAKNMDPKMQKWNKWTVADILFQDIQVSLSTLVVFLTPTIHSDAHLTAWGTFPKALQYILCSFSRFDLRFTQRL